MPNNNSRQQLRPDTENPIPEEWQSLSDYEYKQSYYGQKELAEERALDKNAEIINVRLAELDRRLQAGEISQENYDKTRSRYLEKMDKDLEKAIANIDAHRQDYRDTVYVGSPEEQARYDWWLQSNDAENQANLDATGRKPRSIEAQATDGVSSGTAFAAAKTPTFTTTSAKIISTETTTIDDTSTKQAPEIKEQVPTSPGITRKDTKHHNEQIEITAPDHQSVENGENHLDVPEIEQLSKTEADKILQLTAFNNENARELISSNVPPEYALGEIDGANIWLSRIVQDGGRPYTVMYVKAKNDNEAHARLFYCSNSSTMWRFTPFMRYDGWISKTAYGENAANAPIVLQKILQEMKHTTPLTKGPHMKEIADNLIEEYIDDGLSWTTDRFLISRYQENPLTPCTQRRLGGGYDLADPWDCEVAKSQSPNFEKEILSWQDENDFYRGKITMYCYESNDKSLRYLFCQDEGGGVWIAAIEPTQGKISSLGLKTTFIEPGCLTTPLLEYGSQSGRKGGDYWGYPVSPQLGYARVQDYLDQIPMIKEFKSHHQK